VIVFGRLRVRLEASVIVFGRLRVDFSSARQHPLHERLTDAACSADDRCAHAREGVGRDGLTLSGEVVAMDAEGRRGRLGNRRRKVLFQKQREGFRSLAIRD